MVQYFLSILNGLVLVKQFSWEMYISQIIYMQLDFRLFHSELTLRYRDYFRFLIFLLVFQSYFVSSNYCQLHLFFFIDILLFFGRFVYMNVSDGCCCKIKNQQLQQHQQQSQQTPATTRHCQAILMPIKFYLFFIYSNYSKTCLFIILS